MLVSQTTSGLLQRTFSVSILDSVGLVHCHLPPAAFVQPTRSTGFTRMERVHWRMILPTIVGVTTKVTLIITTWVTPGVTLGVTPWVTPYVN